MTFARTLLASLLLSGAVVAWSPAVAADVPDTTRAGARMGASLPELSPVAIAGDVSRTRLEGRTTYQAPDFDPFESRTDVAGRASLRSGEDFRLRGVDLRGAPLIEGAVLDVTMVYAAESRDPYDLRGYGSAGWLGGGSVREVAYEPRLLECSTRVSEAGEYPDGYFRGDSHGSVVGIHTRYPRYRHHRDFGFRIDDGRPSWERRYGRRYDGRYGDGYGGGYGGGYGYDPYVGGPYRPYRRDVRRRGRGWTGGVPGRTLPRSTGPRSPGTRTGTGLGNPGGVLPGRRDVDDRRPTTRRPVGRPPSRRGTPTGRAPREGRLYEPGFDGPAVPGASTSPANPQPRGAYTPGGSPAPIQRRRPRAPGEGVQTPRGVKPAATPDRPVSRPLSRPVSRPVSRPAPRPSKPAVRRPVARPDVSRPVSRPKPSRPAPKPTPRRVDRATDRAFGGSKPDAKPRLRWQASLGDRPAGLCAKEETLSLLIPLERLEASRFDGLTVLVEDARGATVPVFVPPNYVEGFLIAVSQDPEKSTPVE